MTITERRPAREMVDEKRVFLPEFPHTLPELKTAGYDSVGLDILIGATDPATGGPVFLFEVCAETAKTRAGQLTHPKETMKRDESWNPETFDDTVRRCLADELLIDVVETPLFADSNRMLIPTETHRIKNGVREGYKAFILVLWSDQGFPWMTQDVSTPEVQGWRIMPLGEILNGDPEDFRLCTQEIFTKAMDEGFFQPPLTALKPVEFRPQNPGFVFDIRLKDLHA
ncbi:MAG: hypothetical protein WBB49_00335 [Microgenomates group bacterium]